MNMKSFGNLPKKQTTILPSDLLTISTMYATQSLFFILHYRIISSRVLDHVCEIRLFLTHCILACAAKNGCQEPRALNSKTWELQQKAANVLVFVDEPT
jgi:hypothetical protein